MEDLITKVKQSIENSSGVKVNELTENFREDLGFDSLDIVELVMELEYEFDIEISDEEIQKIKTVQQCIDFIKKVIKK